MTAERLETSPKVTWNVSVAATYKNCGNPRCRKGCYAGGAKTELRPHGPYTTGMVYLGTNPTITDMPALRRALYALGARAAKLSERADGNVYLVIPFPAGSYPDDLGDRIAAVLLEAEGQGVLST